MYEMSSRPERDSFIFQTSLESPRREAFGSDLLSLDVAVTGFQIA